MTDFEQLQGRVDRIQAEVVALRDYVPRFTVVEAQVQRVQIQVDQLAKDIEEARLTETELKTNWRLAVALGGLLGTLIVGVMLWVATGGPS